MERWQSVRHSTGEVDEKPRKVVVVVDGKSYVPARGAPGYRRRDHHGLHSTSSGYDFGSGLSRSCASASNCLGMSETCEKAKRTLPLASNTKYAGVPLTPKAFWASASKS